MRLSIITVVKDDTSGLTKTITSVDEQQSVESVEHLIVDSSTPRAVLDGEPPHWVQRHLVSIDPTGVYPAMNRGLELATGEYIWFLNAGDSLASPVAISTVLRLLASGPEWLVGRVRVIDRSGRATDSARWDFVEEAAHSFARGRFPPHQATITRASALGAVGAFDTSYMVTADYRAALLLAREAEPVMTDEVLAEFREGGLSTTRWRLAHSEFHRARREVLEMTRRQSLREFWDTAIGFAKQFLHRSVLKADR